MRAATDLGATVTTSDVIATRGERLALLRIRMSIRDHEPSEFGLESLNIVEIDTDVRIAAIITFDPDDIDAAFEELDARYLAGEAEPYAQTWSGVMSGHAMLNRHEITATTPDLVSIDHRRGPSFPPGELIAYIRAGWDLDQDVISYVETVHRLTDLGAVTTHAQYGSSQEGFDAEWRAIALLKFKGDMLSRCEIFDEADLDAALARFDELSRPAPRLENAATRVIERVQASLAAHDWDAIAEILADDISDDDRRRAVNAGIRRGPQAEIDDMRAIVDLGATITTSDVIATRGDRLALLRIRGSIRDQEASAFDFESLNIVEIDTDVRIAAIVTLDHDDIGAAFEELDARYLAGEAAGHAHTWSLITRAYAGFNRGELAASTQDWTNVDHRHAAAMAPGDLIEFIRAAWELGRDVYSRIETVHQLNDLGAAVARVTKSTSREGFDAEWRTIDLVSVEGEQISRFEMFDDADLDAALARFEELHTQKPRLENVASRAYERVLACNAVGDRIAVAEILADDFRADDRRPVVGAGIRDGRNASIADLRATADLGIRNVSSAVVATRGERLVLARARYSRSDKGSDAFLTDVLNLFETNADERIAAAVVFAFDELDAALEELDARYLAGEAASHAHTWSVITAAFAAFNRREPSNSTPDWVDHRLLVGSETGDLAATIPAAWDMTQNIRACIDAVHRLTDRGAVITYSAQGTSREGFDFQLRMIDIFAVDGDLIERCEMFDETDLGAALARFDELSKPRLENAASRAYERLAACIADGDWIALAETLADDFRSNDRRPVVGAGIQDGRDALIADLRVTAELGIRSVSSAVVATRGDRLVLVRARYSRSDQEPGAFLTEVLNLFETNADDRTTAAVVYAYDALDAALEELDARYLAGEAAAHAHTWSVITRSHAAINRHELPPTTPDWVNLDHRRGRAFAPGGLTENIRVSWDLTPNLSFYIEAVHRLTDLGVVITTASRGTSKDGFDAEWKQIDLLTVEGDRINRCELFDEADIGKALTRFDELERETQRLGNKASRTVARFQECFAARDWNSIAQILAEDVLAVDRRPVMDAGMRDSRDINLGDWRAVAEVGFTNITSTVLATRGERLVLGRFLISTDDQRTEAFHNDVLGICEINADNRLTACIMFDLDDRDAAFAELDARYLSGEAAPHAQTWSAISGAYAALNRRELPATTPDWVNIDHRRGAAFAPGDLTASILASWNQTPDISPHIEAVHRLSNLGAVVTEATYGTSQDGFAAEWREVDLVTVDGELINRCEIFDEADLDSALARFDELRPTAPRLENAASRLVDRSHAYLTARNWTAIPELLAEDMFTDDRRRLVGAETRRGRAVNMADGRALADVGTININSTVVAIRGEHLVLDRSRYAVDDEAPDSPEIEVLRVCEMNTDNRLAACVVFDPEDIDAAFAELDARYLADEAARHAEVWSEIVQSYAEMNRHEIPQAMSSWKTVDHRVRETFEGGDLTAYARSAWDLMPDVKIRIEAVHRLSDLGAVATHVAYGTSQDGFEAEWRMIVLLLKRGENLNRCELFNEADIGDALTRFDDLSQSTSGLKNTTSQVFQHFQVYFAARDWDALAGILAEDMCNDDRRRVVGSGILLGRDTDIAHMRAIADVGAKTIAATVLATRGERLALSRILFYGEDQRPEAFQAELLGLVEIDVDDRIVARLSFDTDDIDAAFAELDARYLAGEAADYARAWTVIADVYAGFNRHELPLTTQDWVAVDHRPLVTIESGDMAGYLRNLWELTPQATVNIEAVHRLSGLGAVVTHAAHGISQEGFDAEWRMINLFTVEGDLIRRCEIFDEADLDAALARFDELGRPAS